MKAFKGHGVVNLLDTMNGALLLEKLIPGIDLSNYFPEQDEEAIHIVCDMMKRLYNLPLPKEYPFPTINEWLRTLERGEGVPLPYLIKARHIRDKLLSTSGEPKLLHGDLHHYNILSMGKTFTIIDPKGVIGEQAYEVAAFIRNPIPDILEVQDVSSFMLRRINEFSKCLHLGTERLKAWSFVQGVLSWIWALEDGTDPTFYKTLTEIMDQW